MLAIWALALLALTRRVYLAGTSNAPGEVVAPVAPASAYFAVRIDSVPVGLASVTIDTLSDAVRVSDVVDLRLPLDSGTQRYVRRGEAQFSRSLRFRIASLQRSGGPTPDSVTFAMQGDSVVMRRYALRRGMLLDGDTMATAGRPTLPTMSLGLAVVFLRPPRVGGARDVALIDPETGRVQRLKLSIVAESLMVVRDSATLDSVTAEWHPVDSDTVRAWHVVADHAPAPNLWVDEHGLPLQGEVRPGLELVREPFEVVSARHRAALAAASIPPVRPPGVAALRDTPPSWRRARVVVSAIGELADLADSLGAQRRSGDTLLIEALGPDAHRAVATRVVSFARTAQRSGPAESLPQRTVRLARAAGVDARVVAGVVADGHGHWYRHNWVEILTDGQWIGIDPARAAPVTAAYVRLVAGRLPGTLELLSLAARLNPRVLSVQ